MRCHKLVDDFLVWASSNAELVQRLEILALRCRKYRVILSKKKCVIGSTLPFAGYFVSSCGVKPDPDRITSLRKFPALKDSTGVRSFLGLANQLAFFVPDFSQNTKSIRELLGKGKVF